MYTTLQVHILGSDLYLQICLLLQRIHPNEQKYIPIFAMLHRIRISQYSINVTK